MIITQTPENIQITISKSLDKLVIQRIIDYVQYLEIASKSKAKQKDVDDLADEINANWWKKNKQKFIK